MPSKRLVVVSYHFPPDDTVGARRWARFSELFAAMGWGVEVVAATPDAAQYSTRWTEGVTVHYVPVPSLWRERAEATAWRLLRRVRRRGGAMQSRSAASVTSAATAGDGPHRIRRGWELGTVRGWFRMYWALLGFASSRAWGRRAARRVREIAATAAPDLILSSAPPHPAHTPVAAMARKLGIPFVMDMRDPWSLAEGLPEHIDTPLFYRLATREERACVDSASLVVANTPMAAAALSRVHAHGTDRIIAIANGSDDEEMPPPAREDVFSIAYAGTVYTPRDVTALLQAVALLVRSERIPPDALRVRFMGDFGPESGCPVATLGASAGIAEYVDVFSRRPRCAALAFLARATVIATFPGFNLVSVPAKVYESVQFEAWLLALSPPLSATAELLAGTEAAVIDPEVPEAVAEQLRTWYDRFRHGERPGRPVPDDRLGRQVQAERLVGALNRILEGRRSAVTSVAPAQQKHREDSVTHLA